MFNIVDPVTKEKYNIFEYEGRNILKKYIISYKNGGSGSCKMGIWSEQQSCLIDNYQGKAEYRKELRGEMIQNIIENIIKNNNLQEKSSKLGLKIDLNDVGSDELTSDKDINISFKITDVETLKKELVNLPKLYDKLIDIVDKNINEKVKEWKIKEPDNTDGYNFMSKILDVNFYFPTTLFKFSNLEGINKEYYLTFEEKDDVSTIFFIPIINDVADFKEKEYKKMIINDSIFDSKNCLDIKRYNNSFTTNKTGGDDKCNNIDNIYNDYKVSIGTCVKNLFNIALNLTGSEDEWNDNFYCTQKSTHIASEQYQTISSFIIIVGFNQLCKSSISKFIKFNGEEAMEKLKLFAEVALIEQLIFYLNHDKNVKYFGRAVLCYLLTQHDEGYLENLPDIKNIKNLYYAVKFTVQKLKEENLGKDFIKYAGNRQNIETFIDDLKYDYLEYKQVLDLDNLNNLDIKNEQYFIENM